MTDRDETSAIRSPLGVLLLGPGARQSQLVNLEELPPDEPVELPGLNDLPATVVRPWQATRHQRAAEYRAAHPPAITVAPNPFRSPQGYSPPPTVDLTALQHGERHEHAVRASEALYDDEALDDPAGALGRHRDRLAAISKMNISGGDPRAPHARQWAESLVSIIESEES